MNAKIIFLLVNIIIFGLNLEKVIILNCVMNGLTSHKFDEHISFVNSCWTALKKNKKRLIIIFSIFTVSQVNW